MTIQITIIGLGQIGASVGLSLGDHPKLVRRVGHDLDFGNAQRAEKMGAVDKVALNLVAAVKEADLVLLSLPIDQIHETLKFIAPELKEGAVVMDTGPVKEVVSAWAGELLPDGRYYVGLTPVLSSKYLHEHETGISAAHRDLFQGGLIAIITPPRTSSAAIKLAADLARLLGAAPLFFDPVEVDSLMAATHTLPQLVAAALLNATVDQPGWREGRKIAGRAYAEMTGPITLLGEAEALTSSALLNRDHVLQWLDSLIASLQTMRNDIANENGDSLEMRLQHARQCREVWWSQRQAANWQAEEDAAKGHAAEAGGLGKLESGAPAGKSSQGSEVFGRLLGIGRSKRHP